MVGKDEGIDLIVEDLEQFGEGNRSINEETELNVSIVLFFYTETYIVGNIVFRVVISNCVVSSHPLSRYQVLALLGSQDP